MIRAVFTDVDGTLLNAERQLSARTIHAIRAIAEKATVVLASSRMPAAMRHLQAELNIGQHPLICYNGGYVIAGGQNGTVFASHTIPLDVCSGIVEQGNALPIHISLYHADDWYAKSPDQWTEREERITKAAAQYRPFDEVLQGWERSRVGAHKIMCMGEAGHIAKFYDWLMASYGARIHIYKSRPTYLELATKEVSKATGMHLLLGKVGVAVKDAMAFGDNYNDVEMLREAGIGVAVGNAVQEAIEAANEITATGKEDGVAQSLERHFGLTWLV